MSEGPAGGLGLLKSVPPEYRKRGYRHTISWVFCGAFFAVVQGQGPFVIRQLGGSALQSLLMNAGQGLPLVLAILWVPLIQRRNPVRLTSFVLGLGGLVMLSSGLARSTWSFSLVLACSLLPTALYRPILGTALQRIYPAQWRGKLLSLPSAADMLCRVLVLVFVGRLLRRDLEAYRVVFPLAGLCMLVGALLFRSIPGSRGDRRARRAPQSRSLRGHALDAVRAALDNKALLVFLIGYSLATCGGVLHGNALPLFAKDEIGLNTAQWGYAIAASLVVTLATFWFWGAFMDRFSAPLTMVICWAALAALTAAVFFVESWPALLAIMTARGLFFSGNLLAFFPIVMHFTRSSETTRGMALHSSLWGIRWVMMPLVVVFVVDGALFPTRYLFLVSFCLIAVGATTMARVWWLGRKESGDAGSLS